MPERESLSRLCQSIRSGDVQSVIVMTVDRLSRNQAHLLALLEEMSQHNTMLVVAEIKQEKAE